MAAERWRIFRGATELNYSDLETSENDTYIVNEATMEFERSDTVTVGAVIDVTLSDGTTTVFSAKVVDKNETEMGTWKAALITNGWELTNTRIEKTWTNTSPEDIVQDIVDNYTTNLTYIGTATSGVTIDEFKGNGLYAIDIIKKLIVDTLKWGIYIDHLDQVDCHPKGETDNGVTFTNGDEFTITEWQDRGTEIINHVKLIGGSISKQTQETLTGTGTTFNLTYKPSGVVRFTESGTEIPATVDGQYYTVDAENKQVTFTSSRTNPVASYAFEQPIVVEDQDDESINTYWEVFKEIPAPYIKTFADARRQARAILSASSDPPVAVEGYKPYLDFSVSLGEQLRVADPIRGKTDRILVVEGIRRSASSNQTKYVIGTRKIEFIDWQRGIEDRIKELEIRTSNEDQRVVARIKKHDMNVTLTISTLNWRYKSPNDSFILGHTTLGRLRTSLNFEADCSDNGRNGTWQGSSIGGSQYSTSGYRLSCGQFNGSNNYIDVTGSITGLRSISFAVYNDTNNRDIIKLSSTAKISVNSSGDITTTGLSNVNVYVDNVAGTNIGTGSWKVVQIDFDSVTANDIEIGRSSSYFDGKLDEVLFFSAVLSSSDRADIIAKDFYSNHSQYANCELWASMDNPRLGDRFDASYTDI